MFKDYCTNQSSETLEKLREIASSLNVHTLQLDSSRRCLLRGKIWKALLGVRRLSADYYANLIQKGPSPQFEKIQNDIHRTFKNDSKYHQQVSDDQLIRILNAFVWEQEGTLFPDH